MRGDTDSVQEFVDEHAAEAVELLQLFMQISSANPPGDEYDVAAKAAEYARGIGMEVEQQELVPRRVSNICRFRGTEGSPVILFNSHLDTPAIGNASDWTHPPLGAEIHDGAVWGVGARSAKAGLAATLFAVKTLKESGVQLKGDIVHVQTADELGGGVHGWAELVGRQDVHADFGVFTEANPPAKVEIAARGMLVLEFEVHGFARHTKYKVEPVVTGRAVNAIPRMATVIQAIESMEFTDWHPHQLIPGPPVISVNRVSGGYTDTMMADRCTARADCRFLPSQTPASVLADVKRVLDELRQQDPTLLVDVSVVRSAPALEVDPGEPIVLAMQRSIARVIGHELPLGGVGSTSDMRWMVHELGIPSCKFMFPTSETGTDEHESIDDYLKTIKVYAELCLDLLS